MVEAKDLLETLRLQTLGVTVRDVQVTALVETLAATLAKVEAETLGEHTKRSRCRRTLRERG